MYHIDEHAELFTPAERAALTLAERMTTDAHGVDEEVWAELRTHWDLAIWLDVSIETMIERAAKRDVAWVGDDATVRQRYLTRWAPTHRLYEATGARTAAHVIIDNEAPLRPRLVQLASH